MEYEKFDVERALAGEPVILRDGRKAYVRHKEEEFKLRYPLSGLIISETLPFTQHTWRLSGLVNADVAYDEGVYDDYDIVGMYPKEPPTMPDSFWGLLTPEMVAIAKDGSGRWFCYSHEPTFRIEDEEWEGEDMTKCYALSTFNPEIFPKCEPKDSLIIRPSK